VASTTRRSKPFFPSSDVDAPVFASCNLPNCPRTSIYEASDFGVVLVDDAVSGLYDRERNETTRIGIAIVATRDVVEPGANRAQYRRTTHGLE
jgi:hypothetical protein